MMRKSIQALYDGVPFAMDAVRDRRTWKRWRERTRSMLLKALGLQRFPARTPLDPQVVGVLDRGEYVIEKLVFETRRDFLMTANLYRPKAVKGRVPAVLCVHGHTMKGKTSESMQLRSSNYARAGWVALAVDATGHGERVHIGHRRTFAIMSTGMTLEGVQVWDNMRCVDYLLSRPEVDPKRIGITGCSGGGNQTMYTAAVDERIAVAVPVCSVSTLRGQIFTPNGIGCQCECIPDLMRYGLENAEVCGLIAPRPLLVLSGTKDAVFPVAHTRVANAHLERFYEAINHTDRYKYAERRLPHGYQRAFRQLAHAWFDRWFNRKRAEVPYRERATMEEAEDLWCFPGGRPPSDSATLGSVFHDLARKQIARLQAPSDPAGRKRLRSAIRNPVLGGFPRRSSLDAREGRTVMRNGIACRNVTLTAEGGIRIGARLLRPATVRGPVPCVVRVRKGPSRRRWVRAKALLDKGIAVAELDVRPLGDDEHVSRAALVLGRPLVGMGAYDITRFVDYLSAVPEIDGNRISLWAEDLMALPALYAMALDERIGGAALVGLLSTFVSQTPVQVPTWTLARGLLKYADIDHLAALIAPRPLVLAGPVGPDLKPLSAGALSEALPVVRAAYEGSRRLRIQTGTIDLTRIASLAGIGCHSFS